MNVHHRLSLPLLIVAIGALSGCLTRSEKPAAPELSAAQIQAQKTFDEGMRLYNAGHYFLAEEQFLSPDIWAGDTELQVKSLKYLAFSYCVSERMKQCRFAFERALQLDPNFRLENGDEGHPLWGPVFAKAANR